MTIEELNKLIKEELEAYLGEEEGEEEGGDDIEVTTDEPEAKDDEALDTLRQIFNMLKPIVEPEGDEEPEMDMDSDEGEEDMEDEADEDMNEGKDDEKDEDMKEGKDDEKDEDMKEGKDDEKDEDMKEGTNSLNESFDQLARFKKLANIK
jgi:hypothetical protein|tara:strand:- start:46 stop:495 length:450 start_codon:yes stop_codon:yes gene_type:complete